MRRLWGIIVAKNIPAKIQGAYPDPEWVEEPPPRRYEKSKTPTGEKITENNRLETAEEPYRHHGHPKTNKEDSP